MGTPGEKRTLYTIKIQGPLDNFATIWNGDIRILRSAKDETLLACWLLDQAALRGFLNQLWNLNFTILTVERIETMGDGFPAYLSRRESNDEK